MTRRDPMPVDPALTAGRQSELRLGRNFIRRGDYCSVRRSEHSRAFRARFQYAEQQGGRWIACLWELEAGRYVATRFVDVDRIQRKARDPYAEAAR